MILDHGNNKMNGFKTIQYFISKNNQVIFLQITLSLVMNIIWYILL